MRYALVSLANTTPGRVRDACPANYSVVKRINDLAVLLKGRDAPYATLEHIIARLADQAINARELNPQTAAILLRRA